MQGIKEDSEKILAALNNLNDQIFQRIEEEIERYGPIQTRDYFVLCSLQKNIRSALGNIEKLIANLSLLRVLWLSS